MRRGKRWKSEKGQSMVEFALVLPILILLVCGILDFGWIFANQLAAENASREAARQCAVDSTADAQAIVTDIAPTLDGAVATVSVSGSELKVTVTCSVPVLTGIGSTFLGSTYTVTAETTMRKEYS